MEQNVIGVNTVEGEFAFENGESFIEEKEDLLCFQILGILSM